MKIETNYSLKKHNTFNLDVNSTFFSELKNIDELIELTENKIFRENIFLIIGEGSNILFTKNYEGLIIKLQFDSIQFLEEDENHVLVKVGAGFNWHNFVLYCIKKGWGGIENLSLIPGTVGAAPIQNIGAYGQEFKDTFYSLTYFDLIENKLKIIKKENCKFGYRDSIFKNELKGKFIITDVTFKLNKKHSLNYSYGTIEEELKKCGKKNFTIKDISDAVISIRKSKLPNPAEIGNAGSFFKNPIIENNLFEKIKLKFENVPSYPEKENKVKIPAAWLIEKCGWKGYRKGNIGVHEKQPLVLVNYGGGNGEEIKLLSDEIKKSVFEIFNIKLEAEVTII